MRWHAPTGNSENEESRSESKSGEGKQNSRLTTLNRVGRIVGEAIKHNFVLSQPGTLEARRIVENDGNYCDADLTLGELPPPCERLKEADVLKLCDEWQPRFLVLTCSDLMITLPQSQEISDKIPLVLSIFYSEHFTFVHF